MSSWISYKLPLINVFHLMMQNKRFQDKFHFISFRFKCFQDQLHKLLSLLCGFLLLKLGILGLNVRPLNFAVGKFPYNFSDVF